MKVQRISYTLLAIALAIGFIVYSQKLLVPFILAIVLWYLINAVNFMIKKIPLIGVKIPKALSLSLSSILVLSLIVSIGGLIAQTINGMIITAPDYKLNLEQQLQRIFSAVGYSGTMNIQNIASELDINQYLGMLINSFSSLAQMFVLVLIYTIFLLLEQNFLPRKIAALRIDKERKNRIASLTSTINKSVQTYIGVKFAASFATGFFSYLVIQYAGVDFALFWAFLIFVFNFIPTIGSIAATLFPSLIALVQFETLTPFLITIIGVGVIQIIIGGFLEPKLYGDSLNISPLVIIISLVFWGMLWGIVGMILCVPITVIMINVFSQFPNTRPVAVMLSQNGRVPNIL